MENPQFSPKEEVEKYSAELPVPKDGIESVPPETTSIPESSEDRAELTGWRSIQETRKRRQYGSNDGTQQTSSPSHPDGKSCIHHWRIEEVQGPISMGSCLGCNATKEFKNWTEELDGFISYERKYGTNKH